MDVAQLLAESGVSELDGFSSVAAVTERLRAYVSGLNGADALDAEAARVAALRELKAHSVRDGRGLVFAAFAQRAAKPHVNGSTQGEVVAFADPAPADEPVDGSILLHDLESFVTRYLGLPAGAAPLLAAFSLASYVVDAFPTTPQVVVHVEPTPVVLNVAPTPVEIKNEVHVPAVRNKRKITKKRDGEYEIEEVAS